jgi:hypothetical protein
MRRVLIAGVPLLAFGIAGCTRPEDYLKVVREQRLAYKDLANILSQVKDARTMTEAKDKIIAQEERCAAIAKKAQALPQPPPAEVQELCAQELFLFKGTFERYEQEVQRISRLEGGPEFLQQVVPSSQALIKAVEK